jgi:hypothetical protein
MRRRLALLAIGTAMVVLVVSPPAFAVQRFADPAGDNATSDCTSPDPTDPTNPACTLQRAVEVVAQNGDEVIVAPGDYPEGTNQLQIGDDIEVHGAAGQPLPRIMSSAAGSGVFVQSSGASLRRLEVEYTGNFVGIHLGNGTTGEQLVVDATDSACDLRNATLRDSVCWTHGATNESAVTVSDIAGAVLTPVVRNVTAVGTGTGVAGVNATALNGASVTIDAQNVIASGTLADARAFVDANVLSVASVDLGNSNYMTQQETGGTGASVTDPGTGTNQITDPVFVDETTGDFHQEAGSPTIDAGNPSATLLGTLDFEGDPRVADGDDVCPTAPDIGADELVSPNPPPDCSAPVPEPEPEPQPEPQPTSQDTDPPETTITKEPPDKGEKNKVRYKFVADEPSTFECKADKGGFEACDSPEKLKVDDGKHKFQVVAIDVAGNRDPTPAKDKFKVVG